MTNWQNVQLTPRQTGLAIVFICLIIGFLLLRLYFYDKAYDIQPPDHIVANNQLAVVSFNRQLYVLNSQGQIQQAHALTKAGITGDIADMQLLDNDTILLADWDKTQIKKCHLQTLYCESITISFGNKLGRFFKFHYRAEHNDILLADTDRHRILQYDIPSKNLFTLSEKKQFIYPNHIRVESDGQLYVTDTNNNRIARFNLVENKLVQGGESLKVPKSASKNRYPIYYQRLENGDIYVLQANRALSHPDLIYFTNSENPRRIAVKPDADLTVMAVMDDRLLITDRNLYTIHSIDTTTQTISEFGSAPFSAELQNAKRQFEESIQLGDIMLYLMIATIIGIVAFIIFLSLAEKKSVPQSSGPVESGRMNLPSIPPGTIFWIDKNSKFRFLFIGLIILVTVMGAVIYSAFSLLGIQLETQETLYNKLFMAISMFMAITLYTIFIAYINLSDRIGTDGQNLLFKRLGKVFSVAPATVFYSEQYIQFDRMLFAYRNNMKVCFHDSAQFEDYIQPLLHNFATKVNNLGIFKKVLRNPGLYTVLNVLFFVIITTSFFIIYWQDIVAG